MQAHRGEGLGTRCALRRDPFDPEACELVLLAWKDTWLGGFGNGAERRSYVRALFQYALGSGLECRYAYSFCQEAWVEDSTTWRCVVCEDCMRMGDWHCARCYVCVPSSPASVAGLVLRIIFLDHKSVLEMPDTVTEVRHVIMS